MTYVPKWKEHEKGLFSSDLETAAKATEAFTETKELELKTSAKARNWEDNKKKELAAYKPKWVKAKREAEAAPFKQMAAEIKRGGKFDTGLTPMPGFVLVKPEVKEQTDSGIYLSTQDPSMTNTGEVLAIGGKIVHLHEVVEPPVKPGDRVMIKKGLPGLEMTIKGEYCLLMQWSDLLATFDKEENEV